MIEWLQSEGWIYVVGIGGSLLISVAVRMLGIDDGDGPGNFPDFEGSCD